MKKYVEKYKLHILVLWVLTFMIHGGKLYTDVIGIDTEDLIHLENDFYGGWLQTGRQGLVALKWLTGSLRFRPFLSGIVTLLLLGLCVSGFFLLWGIFWNEENPEENSRANAVPSILVWLLSGWLVLSHPVLTEQLYFTIQSVEVCVGILVEIAVLGLIASYNAKGGKWKLPVGALLLLLPFSIYQSLVVLFIFGTVSLLVSGALSQFKKHQSSKILKEILPFLVVFAAAFGVNMLITKLFFGSSDYLGGQILWGKYDVKDNLRAIAGHILRVFTGYGSVHFNLFFGALSVCFAGMAVHVCVKKKTIEGNEKEKTGSGKKIAKLLFYVAALFCTPFLMTFLCGGSPVIRSQILIPFLAGYLAFSCMKQCTGYKNVFFVLVVAISIAGAWAQSNVTADFYYTDKMRYEQDAYLGRELIQEIQKVSGDEEYPVVVIGSKPFQGNNSCVTGEIFGKSFFDHDVEVEPVYYWSTRRVIGFMHTLGGDFNQIPMEWMQTAVSDSTDMPVWPAEGSVAVKDGMVIIKLSEAKE